MPPLCVHEIDTEDKIGAVMGAGLMATSERLQNSLKKQDKILKKYIAYIIEKCYNILKG